MFRTQSGLTLGPWVIGLAIAAAAVAGSTAVASATPDDTSAGHTAHPRSARAEHPLARARPAHQDTSALHVAANARAKAGGRKGLFTNQSPTLRPAQTGQSATGVVTGHLNPVDPDSSPLTYTVTQNPVHGAAVVNADGAYTYTPQATYSDTAIADSFRVTVSDAGTGFHVHGVAGLINLLSLGILGSSGHTSTATVPVTVAPFGTTEPPLPNGDLRPADLSFTGYFRVPTGVLGPGQYDTLAYGGAALASRIVDGQRHFFLTGHRYANDPLIELVAPQKLGSTVESAPVATLYRYWGDIYDGAKVTAEQPDGTQVNENWTEGLLWDDAGGRLLWSYGNWYAASHQNNPVLGATILRPDGSITVQGPWRTTADSQQTRSFAVFLSRAVSAAAGGATLGLGGRMQSINGSASWGPSLTAIDSPTTDSSPLSVRILASHPISPTTGRSTRAADYQVARNPDGSPDTAGTEPAVDGVGYWTELDETTGAVFVTTGSGNRSALVYTGSQASGLIWYGPDREHGIADGRGYDGSGNHAESFRPVLWFVSESDLVAAADGSLAPSAVNPYATVDLTAAFPELGSLSGLTIGQPVSAADEGRLYVPIEGGAIAGRDPYPVIAVFTIAN